MSEANKSLQEYIKRQLEQLEDSVPKFNNGICRLGCNCIEIAEYKNGGNPVKNYPCLMPSESEAVIKEGNRLIAEFMGIKEKIKIPYLEFYHNPELGYHQCWSFIMPVIEKIEQGDYIVKIEFTVCTIEKAEEDYNGYVSTSIPAASKLSAVWHSVVRFIKSHNANHPKFFNP